MSALVRVGKRLIPLTQVESITQVDRQGPGKSYTKPEFVVRTLSERNTEYRSDDVTVLDTIPNTTPDLVGLLYWPEEERLEERTIVGWSVGHDAADLLVGCEHLSASTPVFANPDVPEIGVAILDRRTGRVSIPYFGSWPNKEDFVRETFKGARSPDLKAVES